MIRTTAAARALLAPLLLAAACTTEGPDADGAQQDGNVDSDPGNCIVVDAAVSPEKIELLTDLAETFNESDQAQLGDECVFARVQSKSSGGAAQLLASGWDEASEGPRPVIWSPASSNWASVLNQRLEDNGESPMAPEGTSFMVTPLVIAMPRPMAEALGWPETPLGFTDVLALAREQAGWGAHGHPEWGPFRLGKTNPNFSTSGLSALIAQGYAAAGKTEGLSIEDLNRPEVGQFAEGVESAVVHYGDITLTFMNNWYRADQRGNPYGYVSAVAVEEKSVIDYNRGDPDGVRQEGEQPRAPRVPLVAIYPEEGTIYSDNPLIVLDAEWVDDAERGAAQLFIDYVQEPANQERVLEYGFRPGNPDVPVGAPINADNGVDADQPRTLLETPSPEVLARLLDDWEDQRKPARVLLLIDISGSMGEVADPETGRTRLDLAKEAAASALDDFNDDDEVGLSVFSTGLGNDASEQILELLPLSRVGDVKEQLRTRLRDLVPTNGTPLYTAVQAAYEDAVSQYDPSRINALVLLSDGVNDDGDDDDDDQQLEALLDTLSSSAEGQQSRPVRVFPIGFSADADAPTLRRIADASQAAYYSASDPRSISKVFVAVVSNF